MICNNCQKNTTTIYRVCEKCMCDGWCRGCGLSKTAKGDMFCDICVPNKIKVATC